VLDLTTGLVHAVRYNGGSGQTDPNRAVCLPEMLN
jgi:hypothetical protein